MGFSAKEELKDRIGAKRNQIEASRAEARAVGRTQGRESVEALQGKLDELTTLVAGGWDQLTEDVSAKLNAWLAEDDEAAS